ncbi:MAG: PaaI family thioesterase [Methanobacteriota archaeon]
MHEGLQDVDRENPCFGCGPENPLGLRIKSTPEGDGLVATWTPGPHHTGPPGILGGGIQATLIDCHGIWTAAEWHARQGVDPVPTYVTAEIHVKYRRPVPISGPVTLRSEVARADGRRVFVEIELSSHEGAVCTTAEVVAYRLDQAWWPNPYRERGAGSGKQEAGSGREGLGRRL